jgi:hypothetical protein
MPYRPSPGIDAALSKRIDDSLDHNALSWCPPQHVAYGLGVACQCIKPSRSRRTAELHGPKC